jgi:flavin-dependent dehydrogenase
VFVSTAAGRLRELVHRDGTERTFSALLGAAAPTLVDRVAASAPAGRIHGFGGLAGYVRQSWGPGWALVGDAGYFKDPLTTHGITDALRDADLLTDEVLSVFGGATTEAVSLARYQSTRDRLSSRLFDATERVASYNWDLHQVRTLLRQVSATMNEEVDHLEALPGRGTSSGRALLLTQVSP